MKHSLPALLTSALLGPLAAQASVISTAGSTAPANLSLQPFLTFGLSGGLVTEVFSGTLSVPRVDVPDEFTAASLALAGTSDLRVNGTNIFAVASGVQGVIDMDYEVRAPNGALLAAATRNYSAGVAVRSFLTFWSINYPVQTASATSALTPTRWADFIGTGATQLTWRLTVRQNIFASGGTQQVQLDTLGTTIAVTVDFHGSPDFVNLGGESPAGPTLYADGPATGGASNRFAMFDLPPASLVGLGLAVQEVPVQLFGGTLHANPTLAVFSLVSDANGEVVMPYSWPALPSGFAITLQSAALDAVTPTVVLSNAIRGVTQ